MLFNLQWKVLAFPFPMSAYAVKIASPQERAFCVIQFAQINAGTSTRLKFRKRHRKNPPQCEYSGVSSLENKDCICKGKSSLVLPTRHETAQRVMEAKHGSPRKSTNERQLQVHLPETRIWRVLRKRLLLNHYKMQLVEALK